MFIQFKMENRDYFVNTTNIVTFSHNLYFRHKSKSYYRFDLYRKVSTDVSTFDNLYPHYVSICTNDGKSLIVNLTNKGAELFFEAINESQSEGIIQIPPTDGRITVYQG